MSSDVRDKLREVAPRPSSRVDVDRAWTRGLELRRRRRWALASACVALLVMGVGVATRLPSLTTRAVDRDTRPVAPPLSDAPTVARIVCDNNGTRALTPKVQPQPDGVHIAIYNRSRARNFYMRAFGNAGDNQGGRLAHGENRVVASFPPGDMLVGCFSGSRGPSYFETDLNEYVRVAIVDPHGLWRPSDLTCAEPINAGTVRDGRATGDLVASDEEVERLARSVPGIRPTDVLQRPGYPETRYHAEPRDVIRDGRAVASLDVFQEFGSWKIAVRACPGSGIGPKKGAPAPAPPTRVCSVHQIPKVRVVVASPKKGEKASSPVHFRIRKVLPAGCDATFYVTVDGVPYQFTGGRVENDAARETTKLRKGLGRFACISTTSFHGLLDVAPGVHTLRVSDDQCSMGSEVPRTVPVEIDFYVTP